VESPVEADTDPEPGELDDQHTAAEIAAATDHLTSRVVAALSPLLDAPVPASPDVWEHVVACALYLPTELVRVVPGAAGPGTADVQIRVDPDVVALGFIVASIDCDRGCHGERPQ
jgi:hypothetical protein